MSDFRAIYDDLDRRFGPFTPAAAAIARAAAQALSNTEQPADLVKSAETAQRLLQLLPRPEPPPPPNWAALSMTSSILSTDC